MKAHEASTLVKELGTTKECWEQEKQPFPGGSTPTGYSIPMASTERHTHAIYTSNSIWTEQVVCVCKYILCIKYM